MRHGSLFSGIGGFDLAASWLNWENVFQVEWDSFCQKVLTKNFPNVKRYGDIKEFDGTKYRGTIDILTAGVPCQPASTAGKRMGTKDHRWFWPESFRVIRELQPTWVVFENVRGLLSLERGMAFENILIEMENIGYSHRSFIIPSASIGAWDKRERVWIIAYNNNARDRTSRSGINKNRTEKIEKQQQPQPKFSGQIKITSDTQKSGIGGLSVQQRGQNKTGNININGKIKVNSDTESTIGEQSGKTRTGRNGLSNGNSNTIGKGLQGYSRNDISGREKEQERQAGQANWLRPWIEVASELCGSNARVSNRMERIKALGNSVNPYVVFQIFKAIEQLNESP